jgi:HD superfamily phosphohydrolase YqeK
MKKKEIQTLEVELLEAINRVLEDNNAELTKKIAKAVKKSVKLIVKKNDSQNKKTIKSKKQFSL